MEKEIFKDIWKQYSELNPHAQKIHDLLGQEGEQVINDHVAYRSVNLPGYGIDVLKKPFLELGYKESGQYHFVEKKLYAIHLQHPDALQPKVFISELLLEKMSSFVQEFYKKKLSDVSLPKGDKVLTCGRLWDVSYKDYQKLIEESEYAGWFSAFGYCANHFTIFVNELKKFQELTTLNNYLEQQGFKLNESGGKIKGSKEVYLEQSSTLAGTKSVVFSEGKYEIPACYYEFAKRYQLASGELYQGFVEKSADKIFESTEKKQ